MDELLVGCAVALFVAGAAILALRYAWSEPARRERRRMRNLLERARDAGLRGRWTFSSHPPPSSPTDEYGVYEPVGEEDKALYETVGSRIEGEAKFFASEMLWTDARLAWVGAGLLLLGFVVLAGAFAS